MSADKVEIAMLCDIYGALLSEKEREALVNYYDDDLSLAEIAENTGISRQGVRYQIKFAESKLAEYEEKLGLLAKRRLAEKDLAALREAVGSDEKAIALVETLSAHLFSEE